MLLHASMISINVVFLLNFASNSFCNFPSLIFSLPPPFFRTHMHHEVNWEIFVSAETNWKLMGNNIISIMCTYSTMCIDCINYRQCFSFWFVFTAIREYANDIQTALSLLLLAGKFLSSKNCSVNLMIIKIILSLFCLWCCGFIIRWVWNFNISMSLI